ncbi:ParB-like nuclease domain-containing protein [Streptomyces daliensis]|uniref:ParB-like nuclease domain-containing protein n=1 Tax=Streptomyces daliensis TaxID=299421 RepID=A0A8T4II90_9ACTN|nr:ParB-like nuclease domain-containing protein [Streptomyces daliensis]
MQFGDSPRSAGQDKKYTEQLAESETPLPPILVNRRSMQVVDGVHRVLAAILKGRETIGAVLVDVSRDDAFLLAVESNTQHGLPLSQADRRAAATRLIASHSHMSDRAIARASGLGAKSVAAIRRSNASEPQLNARIGKDGRVRPVDRAAGRRRAAEVIAQNPTASLREVARLAGISPATASDVRRRVLAGESVVAEPAQPPAAPPPEPPAEPPPLTEQLSEPKPRHSWARRPREKSASLLEPLVHDPSVRNSEMGRRLLRVMQFNVIGIHRWFELAEAVPPHCDALVIALARQNADTWLEFAQALDERAPAPRRRRLAAHHEGRAAPAT